MDIDITRTLVHSALSGQLEDVEYDQDPIFHLEVPRTCPGVDPHILNPRSTWSDGQAFDLRARKLAADFCRHFDQAYAGKGIDARIEIECPGK